MNKFCSNPEADKNKGEQAPITFLNCSNNNNKIEIL
jgi:hypothetical protein